MIREFVYLPLFEKNWCGLGLAPGALVELENQLLKDPHIGKVIEGTGGLRKMRFALPNTGKSGGVRVLYVDFVQSEKLFFVNVYAKAKQKSLSDEEKALLKQAVKALGDELRKE
ncbi:MAG: type II toxin-antitoxin system RelE/ParE family toxin [Clostridiales bacterium]|nr:type II toxin-antitoxin system RelE/ParE family toxin [Clostridiales bacterium]